MINRMFRGLQPTTLRDGLQSMFAWIERPGPTDFSYELDLEITTMETPSTWLDQLI
jgi:hypothetical protein